MSKSLYIYIYIIIETIGNSIFFSPQPPRHHCTDCLKGASHWAGAACACACAFCATWSQNENGGWTEDDDLTIKNVSLILNTTYYLKLYYLSLVLLYIISIFTIIIGHNTNIYIYTYVLSTKMMIFVHKQDDHQKSEWHTCIQQKWRLSRAKRVKKPIWIVSFS